MDIRLRDGSGIEACRQITRAHPRIRVIMLTSFADDNLLFQAISAGAIGYVLKQVGNDDLVRAIEFVAQGESFLDPGITGRVLARLREATLDEAFADLSKQELKILALIVQGKTNKEIAAELYLGEGTVRNYVSRILRKLGSANRAEATAYAVQHHLDDYLNSL
jgi:DNA-binding NarL/FixJ family response regulator